MDNQQYRAYLQSEKWKQIAQKRMKIDSFTCVMCGCRGTTANKLEIHHLSYKYLYNEEQRIEQDLITLCHCCHKQIHNAMNRITDIKTGRRGWKSNSNIPQIHVFDLDGTSTDFIESEVKNNG